MAIISSIILSPDLTTLSSGILFLSRVSQKQKEEFWGDWLAAKVTNVLSFEDLNWVLPKLPGGPQTLSLWGLVFPWYTWNGALYRLSFRECFSPRMMSALAFAAEESKDARLFIASGFLVQNRLFQLWAPFVYQGDSWYLSFLLAEEEERHSNTWLFLYIHLST